MTRILAVDVGNTRAKFGVFELTSAVASELTSAKSTHNLQPQLPQALGMSATPLDDSHSLPDHLQDWLETHHFHDIDHSIIAGSNPPQRDALKRNWPLVENVPVTIDHFSQVPMAIDVDEPGSVGIDRLLTAYAARQLVGNKQPIVVIDSGTATTVNLTTSDGTFRGGAILPGLRLSAYALHDYTARLPLIDTDTLTHDQSLETPVAVPGRNTIDAMKAGLFWGQLGAVKEITDRLQRDATERLGETQVPQMVLTGGGGRQLVSQLPGAIYVDCLALHGLAMIQAEHLAAES